MGASCVLYIDGYPVASARNMAPPEWGALFVPGEFTRKRQSGRLRNRIFWGAPDLSEPPGRETVYEYRSTARVVRERLDLLGFTMPAFLADYRAARATEARFHRDIELTNPLKGVTVGSMMKAVLRLMGTGLGPWDLRKDSTLSAVEQYLLRHSELLSGIPVSDHRFGLRAILQYVDDDAPVVYELTDLVQSGYLAFPADENVAGIAARVSVQPDSRFVVLTEGKTDNEILQASMRLVFPHLADYFIWPDLTARPMGGTSGMIQTVKALMSVGVHARVIAVCDNDSEGRRAVTEIRKLGLPSHVQAMCYPNIASATNWPSVGPHGVQHSDLNGRGCSLELYYGSDILGAGGNRPPVHWTKNGHEWHAAIEDKDRLKAAFLRKIAASSPAKLVGDWSDMRDLMRSMMFLVTNPPGVYEELS